MKILNIFGALLGVLLTIGSGYTIYSLINMILTGVVEGNWLSVVAGGILVYFFIGVLIIAFIGGIFLTIISVAD